MVSMPGIWPRWRSSGAATVVAMVVAAGAGFAGGTKIAGKCICGNALMPSSE